MSCAAAQRFSAGLFQGWTSCRSAAILHGELGSQRGGLPGGSTRPKRRIEDKGNEGNYRGTDYIGKLGVEQSFEQQPYGTTGWSKSRRRSCRSGAQPVYHRTHQATP
jgi:hypothetical protein